MFLHIQLQTFLFRCAEQIRNDVDYHKLSVTIVAVGGGLSMGLWIFSSCCSRLFFDEIYAQYFNCITI